MCRCLPTTHSEIRSSGCVGICCVLYSTHDSTLPNESNVARHTALETVLLRIVASNSATRACRVPCLCTLYLQYSIAFVLLVHEHGSWLTHSPKKDTKLYMHIYLVLTVKLFGTLAKFSFVFKLSNSLQTVCKAVCKNTKLFANFMNYSTHFERFACFANYLPHAL